MMFSYSNEILNNHLTYMHIVNIYHVKSTMKVHPKRKSVFGLHIFLFFEISLAINHVRFNINTKFLAVKLLYT